MNRFPSLRPRALLALVVLVCGVCAAPVARAATDTSSPAQGGEAAPGRQLARQATRIRNLDHLGPHQA
jgi:hypothetical protein